MAIIVLGLIERVVGPLRPYTLFTIAKCPIGTPVIEGAI
jgi:hypothetical protein